MGWQARPAWQRKRGLARINSSRALGKSASRGRCGPAAWDKLPTLSRAGSWALGLLRAWLAPGCLREDKGRPPAPTSHPHPTHISHAQDTRAQPTCTHTPRSLTNPPSHPGLDLHVCQPHLHFHPHENSCVYVCVRVCVRACVRAHARMRVFVCGAPLIPFRSQTGQRVAVETCPRLRPSGRREGTAARP